VLCFTIGGYELLVIAWPSVMMQFVDRNVTADSQQRIYVRNLQYLGLLLPALVAYGIICIRAKPVAISRESFAAEPWTLSSYFQRPSIGVDRRSCLNFLNRKAGFMTILIGIVVSTVFVHALVKANRSNPTDVFNLAVVPCFSLAGLWVFLLFSRITYLATDAVSAALTPAKFPESSSSDREGDIRARIARAREIMKDIHRRMGLFVTLQVALALILLLHGCAGMLKLAHGHGHYAVGTIQAFFWTVAGVVVYVISELRMPYHKFKEFLGRVPLMLDGESTERIESTMRLMERQPVAFKLWLVIVDDSLYKNVFIAVATVCVGGLVGPISHAADDGWF